MKFKNSHILLIAISILLLISIGSVCASDKLITNDDDALAESDENVVLTEDGSSDGTTEDKINTTINTDDSQEFKYGDDINFTVNVADNESQSIDVNQSELNVYEENSSVDFTYTNSILSITDTLSVGNHSLIINYLGNENYTSSSKTILLQISGNTTLEAPSTVISNGTVVKIDDVKLFNGVTYTELDETGLIINLTYTDENGNVTTEQITTFSYENGTVEFTPEVELIAASITMNYTDAVNTVSTKIYLSTLVNATGKKISYEDDKNITVSVLDNENSPLNITESDLKILDGDEEITSFTYADDVITFSDLTVGMHNITIIYNGDDTYASSNITVELGVTGNETINPDSLATLDWERNVNITLNLSDGAELIDIVKENLNITLYYTTDSTTLNRTLTQDNITVDNQNIIFNVAEEFDTAEAVINYNNLTATVTLKIKTEIYVSNETVKGDNEDLTLEVIVLATDGYVLDVNDDNLKIYNGDTLLDTSYSNGTITINDELTYGTYNLTVNFIGDDTYSNATEDTVLKVYGINITSSTNINSTKKGEIEISIITGDETTDITKDDLTLNATYVSGNSTVEITITEYDLNNGTLSFTLENGNFTTATLTVTYKNSTANVTLSRIYNANIVIVNAENEYKDGNFTFRLVDSDDNSNLTGRTLKLTTTGNIRAGFSATTDSNGIASFKNANLYVFDQSGTGLNMKSLDVGTYEVDLETEGTVKSTKVTTNLTVTQAHVTITIGSYSEYYNSDKNLTFTVTNVNGNPAYGIILKLQIPKISSTYYYVTSNTNGIAQIAVKGIVGGTYDVTVSTNDTTNVASTSAKGTMTIKKIPVTLSGNNVNMYYNTGTSCTLKVTKNGKGVSGVYVLVIIDGNTKKPYLFQTDKNGKISISASLNVGTHKITASLADNRYSASSITKKVTVKKASAKITTKKVTSYYKGGKYLSVKLTNTKNKKPIYAAKINIKIYVSKTRYYNYNGYTAMNGQIKLLVDSLKPGSYKVVISGASSKNFKASKVTTKVVIKKAPTKIIAKKVTAKKGKSKYFKITAKNKKTKKIIKGLKLKVKVYTGKKAKTYTLKTNSKGIAKLNVKSLKAGTHKVVITSANKYCVAKKATSKIVIKK